MAFRKNFFDINEKQDGWSVAGQSSTHGFLQFLNPDHRPNDITEAFDIQQLKAGKGTFADSYFGTRLTLVESKRRELHRLLLMQRVNSIRVAMMRASK